MRRMLYFLCGLGRPIPFAFSRGIGPGRSERSPMAGRPRHIKIATSDEEASGHSQTGSVQALDRGLALLSIVAQADGLSLTSIAQRAGIAASTAHRILATLKAAGFVYCDEARGGYLV